MNQQRTETIKLYREILRACRIFTWKNKEGQVWRHVLHQNARKEIEMNRYEKDSLIVAKMVFNGKEALNQIQEMLLKKQTDFQKNVDSTRTDKKT